MLTSVSTQEWYVLRWGQVRKLQGPPSGYSPNTMLAIAHARLVFHSAEKAEELEFFGAVKRVRKKKITALSTNKDFSGSNTVMLRDPALPPKFLESYKYTVFPAKGCIFGKGRGNPHADPCAHI